METLKGELPTMTFEREPTGGWRGTARTAAGELVASGETLREARLALEQLLRMTRGNKDR